MTGYFQPCVRESVFLVFGLLYVNAVDRGVFPQHILYMHIRICMCMMYTMYTGTRDAVVIAAARGEFGFLWDSSSPPLQKW